MLYLAASHVRLFVTLWTAARRVPLIMGILQARILEWVAMLSSRGSSRTRGGRQIYLIYWLSHQGSPWKLLSCVDSLWHSPGKNTGVGSYFLLQGIVPTQRSNPGLVHCRSLPSEPPGKSKNTEWVAYPFSRGSSWPSDQTGVSCIAWDSLLSWATREYSNFVEV